MDTHILELSGIAKQFGNTDVLNGIDLAIKKGEFITLLGSSGCGKTTTLRIIAGLEFPDSGQVLLNGTDVTSVEPNHRDVNTVFQNYALFPHMNVVTNIGYSLKLKKMPKEEIKQAVTKALELVQLTGYEKRMPAELSGGQRQRVAIARAIVNNPSVLLLDEPLGALDLQLRRQMQVELKSLQKQLGITFIYITHDQEEALNMSDRIAVMRDGRFEQIGSPNEIYEHPKTSYVARFVGAANILEARVSQQRDDALVLTTTNGVCLAQPTTHSFQVGDTATLAIRSEHLQLSRTKSDYGLCATVKEKSFAGGMLRIVLSLDEKTELIASRHGIDSDFMPGEEVFLSWKAEHAVPVDLEVE